VNYMANPRFMDKLQDRVKEYGNFWQMFQNICSKYIANSPAVGPEASYPHTHRGRLPW